MTANQAPRFPQLVAALTKLYRRYLGELLWLEAPPKSMNRKWRGGREFLEDAPTRAARADHIREALPHIAFVIGIYEPTWHAASAEPIQPSVSHSARPRPPTGWTGAALAVLKDSDEALTIAEIVAVICERYDIDISTVAERQRCHTAVNNPLMRRHRHLLVCHDTTPARWSLRR